MPLPPLSYAQRFEDFHLWRCFDGKTNGFYIDIGAGNPVYDNVSFAFYLAGWRGVCVEPNPALAALNRAVRPRDTLYEGLIGERVGETTFYLQREFHGLSTTIAEHAETAEREVGRKAERVALPVITLATLCERYAPASFDFLKIDVEGAEAEVLRSADFARFRPKIIVVEAIKPFTLAPAWEEWEPQLARSGYSSVWDDELNRYYVAEEARALVPKLTEGPKWYAGGPQIGNFKGAAEDPTHPDHRLACLVAGTDLAKLPLADPAKLMEVLTAGMDCQRPASAAEIGAIAERLFGSSAAVQQFVAPQGATLRGAYRAIIDSDAFRAACGRIAASYAW